MEGGCDNKIAEKVFGSNVGDRSTVALGIRYTVDAIFGIGVGELGKAGVEGPSADCHRASSFAQEVLPFRIGRMDVGARLVFVLRTTVVRQREDRHCKQRNRKTLDTEGR